MKKILNIVVLAVFIILAATPACAETYRGSKLYDLRAETYEGKVVLTWKVDVRKDVGPMWGDTKVTIKKSDSRYMKDKGKVVATLPLTREGTMEMTWTDNDVSPGETWHYRVETGTVSWRFEETSVTVSDAPQGEGSASTGTEDLRKEYVKNVTWPEKLAASIISAIPNWMVKVLGMYDPIELIFMEPVGTSFKAGLPSQAELPYLHVFTESEMRALSTFYDKLTEFMPIHLVVVIVLLVLGILYNSANPESKIGLREYVIGFALAMVVLKFGAQLLTFVFDLNYVLVQQFKCIAQPYLETGQSFLESLILADSNVTLGDAIISFIAALSIGVLNFQYIMRKVIIALLIGLIPVVAVVSIAPSKRFTIGIWFRELIANIFLQSAHAAALAFLLLIIDAAGDGTPEAFWIKLATLLGLAGMAGMVRSVIGAETLNPGLTGTAGVMFGVAGLAALGKILGGRKPAAPGAGAPLESAAGSTAGTTAGPALRAAGAAGRVAATAGMVATGMMAGGMISGATVGDPRLGMTLGAGLGAKGADMLNSPTGYAAGESSDPASSASRQVFGYDVTANRQGLAGLKDKVAGMYDSDRVTAAEKARVHVEGARQALETARADLKNYKPQYEAAKAEHNRLKNLYGPRAAHLEKLEKEKLPAAEKRLHDAEQKYVTLLNVEESARGADYDAQLKQAEEEYRQAEEAVNAIQDEIDRGPEQYRESLAKLQAAEVEYAERQLAVARAEQNLTHEALVKEFTKIKEQQTFNAGGGMDAPQWR